MAPGEDSRLHNRDGVVPPNIWRFLRPHLKRLAAGLCLVALNRLAGLVAPATTKFLIDDVIIRNHVQLLWPLAGAVLLATAIQAVSSLALIQVLSKSAQKIITELRCKLQEHIGRLPLQFYDANKTGALISRIMNDVEGLRTLIGSGLVQFVGSILTALFGLIVLLRLNVAMTLLALTLILAFGVLSRRAFVSLKALFRERIKTHAEIVGRLTETLAGVRVVKGYRKEAAEARVFAAGARRLMQQIFKALDVQAYMNLSSALLTGLVTTTIVVLGTRYVLAGHMTLGSFLTYTAFTGLMVSPILQLVDSGSQFTEAAAGLERMHEVLQEAREDDDPERTLGISRLQGTVEFKNVSFGYSPGSVVLEQISFSAPAGSIIALVGPSGAGKSTLIGLLAGFYKPSSGHLTVDDHDLARVCLEDFRSQLGLVLQETFLFDGTIRENVAFSAPGSSEAAILEACRAAYVHEFAEKFPQGYDTVVGERGVRLSGGQKQRVAIARALLANPRILILDEATSNLDSESEFLIQGALAQLVRGRTTFVIAHRLSTIRIADQILVMEGGRIIERGTHDSLLSAGGRYFELYTRQYQMESNFLLIGNEQDHETADPDSSLAENQPDLPAQPAAL
jgi:ABC-type multidrug transport system fused ATPase/permease subunit